MIILHMWEKILITASLPTYSQLEIEKFIEVVYGLFSTRE
jgi:hypothetical protein